MASSRARRAAHASAAGKGRKVPLHSPPVTSTLPDEHTRPHPDAATFLALGVEALPGVGRRLRAQLADRLGIVTVRDLLEHYPAGDKYHAEATPGPLEEAVEGEPATVVGEVLAWHVVRPPRGRRLVVTTATVVDSRGATVQVPFFNQQWRTRAVPKGARVTVSGVLEPFRGRRQLRRASIRVLEHDEEPGEGVVATYPATEGVSSHRLSRLVEAALDRLPPVPDHLPDGLRARHRLVDLDTAIRQVHRADDLPSAREARRRLVYDELLVLQLGLQRRRQQQVGQVPGVRNRPRGPGSLADRLLDVVPFTPTGAQRRATADLQIDLGRDVPMHRLLQGDVGSGKTLVAAYALLRAVDAGRQAVLMAPTELLAEQHLRTLDALLAPLGVNLPGGPRLELLTGSTSERRRRGLLAQLRAGDVDLLVGTHALLEETVRFHDLGVVVVDEQHRFGAEHRSRLRDKRDDGARPDVLVMTATPIPRSIALTVYGDLDVTRLDELPAGRRPTKTVVLESDSRRRESLWGHIRERAAAGERTYIVTPLVTASTVLEDVASAEQLADELATGPFADFGVGLVHGRLSTGERDEVMQAFREGVVQILVSTTVIEVGVDVAEATTMVVEDADRFGISQLHQLRGRVGRSDRPSWCVLFSAQAGRNQRLEALEESNDGFALAETDLQLRGEGSLFDTRQHGLPDLRLASLARDRRMVEDARRDAAGLVDADPGLAGHPMLAAELARRFGPDRLATLESG